MIVFGGFWASPERSLSSVWPQFSSYPKVSHAPPQQPSITGGRSPVIFSISLVTDDFMRGVFKVVTHPGKYATLELFSPKNVRLTREIVFIAEAIVIIELAIIRYGRNLR